MNHKRGKPKNARAGCLMCKPHKMNGGQKLRGEVMHYGFGKIRDEHAAANDLRAWPADADDAAELKAASAHDAMRDAA